MIWWYTIFHVYGLQIPRLSSEERKFLFWEPILRLKLHLIRGFLALALTTTTHKKLFVEEIKFPCCSCIESANCDFLIPLCEMLRSPVVYNVHNRHRLYLTSISDDISHKQKKRHSCGLKRSVVLCIQGEQFGKCWNKLWSSTNFIELQDLANENVWNLRFQVSFEFFWVSI